MKWLTVPALLAVALALSLLTVIAMPVQYIPKPIKAESSDPVRAFNVIYQNLSLRPILVLVTVTMTVDDAEAVQATATIGTTSPPAFIAGRVSVSGTGFTQITTSAVLVFPVAAGGYYRVTTFGVGAIVLVEWLEVGL